MKNHANEITYLENNTLVGTWRANGDSDLQASLSITKERVLKLSFDTEFTRKNYPNEAVKTKFFAHKGSQHEDVIVGWVYPNDRQITQQTAAIYPDYYISSKDIYADSKLTFDQVECTFVSKLSDFIKSKHGEEGLIILRDQKHTVIKNVFGCDVTFALIESQKISRNPSQLTVDTSELNVRIKKRKGFINSVAEMIDIIRKVQQYLNLITRSENDLLGVVLSDSNKAHSWGTLVMPGLTMNRTQKKDSDNVYYLGVADFHRIVHQTFKKYILHYDELSSVIRNYLAYIHSDNATIDTLTRLSFLLRGIDTLSSDLVPVAADDAEVTSKAELKAEEYDEFISNLSKINVTGKLRKFLKEAKSFYGKPSMGDRVRRLALDRYEIKNTVYAYGLTYAKLIGELRNDIMHGNVINTSKYEQILFDHRSINDIEILVACEIFRRIGMKDKLNSALMQSLKNVW